MLYTNGIYTIAKLNEERNYICDNTGYIICKYDNDKENLVNMIEDFIAFCFEDKIIKSHEQKIVRKELVALLIGE